MTRIAESELILNPDGSVYHLNLLPEQLADTIITVGDPDRVPKVSKYFDSIEHKSQKREIVTHTGFLNGKRITCLSTGMGTDNIDIVMNELDALANINLEERTIKNEHKSLNILRIGTSGSLQAEIPVDSFVVSSHGMGLDGLLYFYENSKSVREIDLEEAFLTQINWDSEKPKPYCVSGSQKLFNLLHSEKTYTGITATASGFYGPQGRVLRLKPTSLTLNEELAAFQHNGHKISNFEMETSALYGLGKLMGHEMLSVNCIIANRPLKQFSKDAYTQIDKLIQYVLAKLCG